MIPPPAAAGGGNVVQYFGQKLSRADTPKASITESVSSYSVRIRINGIYIGTIYLVCSPSV
jgi:hypothetical protein